MGKDLEQLKKQMLEFCRKYNVRITNADTRVLGRTYDNRLQIEDVKIEITK